ncbi:MAG: hypothetical protein JWO58_1554 [Chitinophagaceae bacterium]|nr:hypothetical protein [Chitinophagaceae bacterium]
MAKKVSMNRWYHILFLLCVVVLNPLVSKGQELNIVVTIDASQIPDMQQTVLSDMQSIIKAFVNNRSWTVDQYNAEERIKGNIVISLISLPTQYSYTATAQVQCSRPVYGTTYETILLNYFDKDFVFDLSPGQPLNYNENVFNSNIVTLLSFYANIILAMDYDSFGKLGGNQYIERALNIAGVARDQMVGFNATTDPNNKGSLINNLNNQQFIPYREAWYNYHRKGMDNFIKDPVGSRKIFFETIKTIQTINKVNPYSILLRSFFMAKRDEIINIFKDADAETQIQLMPMLRELDPTNTEKYQQIIKK